MGHHQCTVRSAFVQVLVGLALLLCIVNFANAADIELELPLLVNTSYTGDINTRIQNKPEGPNSTETIWVLRERLHQLLQPFANEDQLLAWAILHEAVEAADTWVELQNLRDLGLDIRFDSNSLTLVSRVARLDTQALSVRGRKKPSLGEHYTQSRFASGMTVYARNTYNHRESRGQQKGIGDFSADIAGFTTFGGFGGWSIFYQGEYDEARKRSPLLRKDVTLIHDDYKHGLRYALGDVRPTTTHFQSTASMLGINVERNYTEINPFRNLKPSGSSGFTLERDSRVKFEVNGIVLQTLELSAGTYSISDFPLAIGVNDVRVLVDDGTSLEEIANFSTYVDTTLLSKGITNFGASLGFLRIPRPGGRRRYAEDVSALGFYEKGVTDNLTLAAQAEVSQSHALLAGSAIVGTRIGVIAAEAAASRRDGFDTGLAATLRYFYRGEMRGGWSLQTDLQARYRSDSFLSLAETVPRAEDISFNARTSLTRNGLSFSLAGERRSIDHRDSNRISATVSKSFSPGYTLSLGYQYLESDAADEGDSRFSLTVSKRLQGHSLRSQYKSHNRESRAEWRTNGGRDVGDTRARVEVFNSLEQRSAEGDFGFIGNRFEMDVNHSTSQSRQEAGLDTSRTHVTMAASMGYADGKFAFGRPFTDGFIILDRHKNLRGRRVGVSRSSDNGPKVTAAKHLSSVLVPLTSSYRSQRFAFAVDELPLGYDLGASGVKVYPGNLAGYRYRLGSDAANTVMGKLFKPSGEPLSLLSGKLQPMGAQANADAVTIFTNRTGRFVAEKMAPGQYRIEFGAKERLVGEVTVVEGDEPGLIRVGDIILAAEQTE